MLARAGEIFLFEGLKLVPVVLLKFIVDAVVVFNPNNIQYIIILSLLTLITLTLLAMMHARFIMRDQDLITSVETDVLRKSKEKMLGLGIDFHEQEALGRKVNTINEGAKDLKDMLFLIFRDILPVTFQVIITLGLMLYFSWEIALAFALFIPIIYWINRIYAARVQPTRKSFKRAYNDASSSLGQSIANIRTVKEFNMQQSQLAEYSDHLRRYYDMLMVRSKIGARTIVHEEVVMAFGRFATLALAIYLVYTGRITAGTLVLAFSLSEKAYINLTRVGSLYIRFDDYLSSVETLADLYLVEENVKRRQNEQQVKMFKQTLRFENVTFQYAVRSQQTLRNITFEIKKGESLAIIGRSGSGKTTMIKVVLRHYDIQKGSILVDGVDIRDLDLEGYRSLFSVVSQDVELFNKSISENIAYGTKHANKQAIIAAAKQAHAHEFITGLKDGYETVIGERGVKLSGGQKQRIAIARALLRKPNILIFDEATSSLDSESEQKIQDAIWKLSKKYTIIIIAHRLSTIMKANNILILEDGTIAGYGTTKEMSKQHPIFKKMLKLQNIGEIRE